MGKKKVTKPCMQVNLSSAQVYSDLSFRPELCQSMGVDTCDKLESKLRLSRNVGNGTYFVSKIILTYCEKKKNAKIILTYCEKKKNVL